MSGRARLVEFSYKQAAKVPTASGRIAVAAYRITR